jgi:hemerythrin-like domain-containing protein
MDMFLLAHKAMRRDIPTLGKVVRSLRPGETARLNALAALFDVLYRTVRMHHTAEDHDICPALTAKVSAFAVHQAALAEQHRQLMTSLRELAGEISKMRESRGEEFLQAQARLASSMTWLEGYVESHLGYEERDMVPCAMTCMTYGELYAISRKAVRRNSKRDVAAALPWVLSAATEEERKQFLSDIPLPARLLYRAWWKPSYERKVRPLSAV